MKYAVLLLALIFAGCTDGGYTTFTSGADIIQIAKEDLPKDMSWDDAVAACQNLGNGWRLPTSEELDEMYKQLHTKSKGNFRTDNFYWSSSTYFHFQSNLASPFYFGEGKRDGMLPKFMKLHVRAVRTLPSPYETFTFDGDTMQIAKADCPSDMSWNDAMAACQNLGNGWRLPSKDELAAMYNQLHTKGKGNFRTDGFYWSSSESNADNAWNFSFNSGVANDFIARDKGYSFCVRAVRAKP